MLLAISYTGHPVYYVKVEKVGQILARALGMLNADRYLLLRVHDFAKHHEYHEYIDVIRGLGSHVEHEGSLLFVPAQGISAAAAH
jgi:hypothetical protein